MATIERHREENSTGCGGGSDKERPPAYSIETIMGKLQLVGISSHDQPICNICQSFNCSLHMSSFAVHVLNGFCASIVGGTRWTDRVPSSNCWCLAIQLARFSFALVRVGRRSTRLRLYFFATYYINCCSNSVRSGAKNKLSGNKCAYEWKKSNELMTDKSRFRKATSRDPIFSRVAIWLYSWRLWSRFIYFQLFRS